MRACILIAAMVVCGQERPLFMLPKETNWGTCTQAGASFSIKGNTFWEAEGHIRADGKVVIIWTLLSTGEACPGVYEVRDKELHGVWGYGHEARIDEKGNLIGEVREDRIFSQPKVDL